MKKVCTLCRVEKDLSSFVKREQSKDGLTARCKECRNKIQKDFYKNRNITTRAKKAFTALNNRCANEVLHEDRPKYKTVTNLLDKNEFIDWYVENYFDGCQVDRINDSGHYEMSNVQLLSKEEHNHKRKLERDGYVKDGFKKCNFCIEIKPKTREFFGVHKRNASSFNPLGLRGICKECENIKRRERYKNTKE